MKAIIHCVCTYIGNIRSSDTNVAISWNIAIATLWEFTHRVGMYDVSMSMCVVVLIALLFK